MKNLIYLHLLLIFLSACSSDKQVKETKEIQVTPDQVSLDASQLRTISIETGKVQKRSLSGAIKVNGMLDVPPQNMVSISAPLGGTIKSTELLQGMKVQKGQELVVMQHPDYIQMQQDYLESKSKAEYLEKEYQRQSELAKENVNSQKQMQQTKAEYETAQAKLSALRAKLNIIGIAADKLTPFSIQSSIHITSPIQGFVTHVNVNIGRYVNPNDVMFTIVDTEHLHAELTVFEKDVPRLRVGQKVRFTLANESKERMATVYLIGREIGPDRTVRVHCHLDKEDTDLLPGMYLKAFVEAGEQLVNALPDEAIVNYEGKDHVFVFTGKTGNYKMYEVIKGISEMGYTEVVLPESLSADAEVVLKGAYELLSALKNKEE